MSNNIRNHLAIAQKNRNVLVLIKDANNLWKRKKLPFRARHNMVKEQSKVGMFG